MKRVQQLQEEAYQQAQNSGIFKNLQAQLKTYVYDIIEREYNNGSSKAGFQYEHPLLPKLKKYPLTSICMDLIQEFLESFKFKHTLNVFKKEINRSNAINRAALTERFKIEIKNAESKAVLLGLVEQMVTGEVGALRANVVTNNFVEPREPAPARTNNFIDPPKQAQPAKPNINSSQSNSQLNQSSSLNNSNSNIDTKAANLSKTDPKMDSSASSNSQANNQSGSNNPSNIASNVSNQKSEVKEEEKAKKGGKEDKNKKKKEEKEKPPEGAADLMGDVLGKFGAIIKTSADKQKQKAAIFEAKRAFSEEKEKKVVDPSESGANKIRGASLGKGMSSMMSKFMTQPQPPPKNQSFIEQDMDEFQQSKDSTRKNPLFSSGESGFDKSGFDQSVDSNVIDDYEYVERARKVAKKL